MRELEYHPYRSSRWVGFIVFAIGIIDVFLAGMRMDKADTSFHFFLIKSILSMGISMWLLSNSLTVFCISIEEIRLVEGWKQRAHYLRWNELPYGYQCRNSKGYTNLVYSPKELTEKQVRHFITYASFHSNIFSNSIIVIPMDHWQAISEKIAAVVPPCHSL